MKETAVDYLFQKLWNTPKDKLTWYKILVDAKVIEKEQIELAHLNGQSEWDIKELRNINKKMAEEYYKENFIDK